MNLLVAINKKYIPHLRTLLKSIELSNPKEKFTVYVLHKDLDEDDILQINYDLDKKRFRIEAIMISDSEIDSFPVYEKRYPIEIYFRIYAAKYLPREVDRVIYLDTDIIVINSLKKLYQMDFQNNLFIAATHIRKILHIFHEVRLGLDKNEPYINSGVMLMNLKELRKVPIEEDVLGFVRKNGRKLMLPDQDIISALYGDRIKLIDDLIYNLGEIAWRMHNIYHKDQFITLDWIRKHTIIIHYYGRNKPWNQNYRGKLNCFYISVVEKMNDDIKVERKKNVRIE